MCNSILKKPRDIYHATLDTPTEFD